MKKILISIITALLGRYMDRRRGTRTRSSKVFRRR